jgi:redox-sensitive bicupin YhaK (pirin superfamily)
MKNRTIKNSIPSEHVNMGPIRLRQPIPSQKIADLDPFILLHHYGPYYIDKNSNPFDLGPHPHRGFEPITFLFQGEQRHRDSLGNEEVVKAGGVQWTTAGYGIVHAEGPTKTFVEKGGYLEGIQLWLNLPAAKKLMPANYQHVKSKNMPTVISSDNLISVKVVSGELNGEIGQIETQTPVNSFIVEAQKGGQHFIELPKNHQVLVYLVAGSAIINDEKLELNAKQCIEFNMDGDGLTIQATDDAKLLVLSGEPLKEPVATYGPFVMNTQPEIIQALNDYEAGKMGYLAP